MQKKKLSVIIPTYNEVENIETMVKRVLDQQNKLPDYDLSIIVSDGHSPDGTGEIVKKISQEKPQVHLLDVPKKGLGIGLKKGYDFAIERLGTDVLLQIDADLSHNPDDIPQLIEKIDQGYDFVQASRFRKGGENRLELHRQFFSLGANLLCRLMMGIWEITDFMPSFRAFTVNLYKKTDLSDIPWQGRSYIFQPSFAFALHRAGAKIAEVPIVFVDREKGKSKLDAKQYIFDLLVFVIKVRLKKSEMFIKFCTVGFIGTIINTFVLWLVKDGLHLFQSLSFQIADCFSQFRPEAIESVLANIPAVESAIVSNFTFNDRWTFKMRQNKASLLIRFLQFNLSSLGAVGIAMLTLFILTNYFGVYYLLANAIGIVLGLFWNYAVNVLVIWRK